LNAHSVRNRQRGGANFSFIMMLVVLGALIFFAVKIAPPYMENFQLQDAMTTEARFAVSTYPKKTTDDLRDDVWRKVQELGVPAKKEDIRTTVDGSMVTISLDYSVPVDLLVYQLVLQFHPHADSHSI
jgi:hypothetical protein